MAYNDNHDLDDDDSNLEYEEKPLRFMVRCQLDAGEMSGYVLLWTVILVCTLGLATPFYLYAVVKKALDHCILEEVP